MNQLATLVRQLLGKLEDEPPPLPMPPRPFEPINRIPWALEQGVQRALTEEQWGKFKAAMPPADDYPELLGGVVEGVVLAIQDIIKENVDFLKSGLEFVVDFYEVVYDTELWGLILTYWVDPSSTPQGLADHLIQNHPALWAAIQGYPAFEAKADKFIEEITSSDGFGAQNWSKAEEWISGLICDCLFGLGRVLKEDTSAFIDKKGDAEAQGKIIGRRAGRAIIEAVMLAMDLYSLIKGAAEELGKIALELRNVFRAPELAQVAAKVEKISAGMGSAGNAVAKSARKDVEAIYQGLAYRIAPYKTLRKETMGFNRGVRHVYGYSIADVDYIALRLDSHHILEADYYDRFKNEFRQFLNWSSADDMDTIALHTEWHIRSGENMSRDLGLLGAEKEKSLTEAIKKGIRELEQQRGGFSNLRQLVEGYEEVYQKYSQTQLYPKLKGWFADVKAKLP